jgi:hypothetical protein
MLSKQAIMGSIAMLLFSALLGIENFDRQY